MTTNEIMALVSSIAPSIVSVISMIATVLITIKKFKDSLTDENLENRKIKAQMSELMEENKELKKMIRTKIDKIGKAE